MNAENQGLDYKDIKPDLKEVKLAVGSFYSEAEKLMSSLHNAGPDAQKAAEVLGLEQALKVHNEQKRNEVLSADNHDKLLSALNSEGGMTYFAKFYSIAKAVYSEDNRFKGLINAFEDLILKINQSSVTDAKIELPPVLFTEFDEAEFNEKFEIDRFPDNDYANLEGVQKAYREMEKNSKGDKVYSAAASGVTYKLASKKFTYKAMVAKVNPSRFYGVYEHNKINF